MKWIAALLMCLSVGLQYRLWHGPGSLEEVGALRKAIEMQTLENKTFLDRNQALEAEVRDLKSGLEALEERGRMELGMVKKDESFFLVVDR